ncbi:hypothetical protein [Ancylobacter sp.]|uniref:hypothetical protein n=1 Tax=Ancylobacter sp. TaxID=1872567 RepID=UPI003C7BE84F
MFRVAVIGLALLTLPSNAKAQDVYEKIGSQLDEINSTLNPDTTHNGYEKAFSSNPPATGLVGQQKPVSLYTSPMPTATSNLSLDPGSSVRIIGEDGKYWAVIPDGIPTNTPFYVPKSSIKISSVQSVAEGAMSKAIAQVRDLKNAIAGSGVSIKKFSVNIGIPPSIDIEFEIEK